VSHVSKYISYLKIHKLYGMILTGYLIKDNMGPNRMGLGSCPPPRLHLSPPSNIYSYIKILYGKDVRDFC